MKKLPYRKIPLVSFKRNKANRSVATKRAVELHTLKVKSLRKKHYKNCVKCEHISGCGTVCNLRPLKKISEIKCPLKLGVK